MKNNLLIIFAFIFLTLLTSCSTSRRISKIQTAPSDSAFIAGKIDFAQYEKKYSKYNGVYLSLKDIYEHSANLTGIAVENWEFHEITSEKYLVLNSDDQDLTTFKIMLPSAVIINNIYLMTLSPTGEIKRFGIDQLSKEITSFNYTIYKFSLPDIKKGSIVEKGIDITYEAHKVGPPLNYDIELQYGMPCENLEMQFAYPDWWDVSVKNNSITRDTLFTPVTNKKDNKKIISYKASFVPPVTDEPFSPFFKEMANYLQLKINGIGGGTNYSSANWVQMASTFRRYAMNNEGIFSTKVRTTTEQITRNCSTPLEKLDTIVSYIQKNISLSYGDKERDFPDVLEDKTGNRLEVCGLAQAMLSKVGLTTDYLLVHSAKDGYFDESYISMAQFSYPAVKVEIDGKDYVVMPYLKNLPVDHIPDFIQTQKALVISNDPRRNGQLWIVPDGNYLENRSKENYDLQIDKSGKISIKEEKVLTGSFAYDVRESLADLKEDEIQKFLQTLLTYTDGNINIINYKIDDLDNYKLPLVIKMEYEIDNLVTITPEEVVFQTGGLFSPTSMLKTKIKPEDRSNPIRIYFNNVYEKNINIGFPSEWNISTKLEDVKFDNSFGEINGKYKLLNNVLNVSQETKLNKCVEPKEKIVDLLNIAGSYSKLSIPTIIFGVKK